MTEKPRFCLRSTARIGLLLVAMGTYSAATCAQTPPPETGVWLDDSGNGAVEIYICAERADRLCGRIVWLREPLNAQGLPKRDRYNPKEELQTRPICGLPVLGNLYRVQEGGFDGGWIYDPKAGKSYSAAIQLVRQDRLTVTGYVGMKFLSKSFTWTRAPADIGRCEGAPGSQAKAAKPAPAQPKPAVEAAAAKAPMTAPVPKPATAAVAPAPKPATPPAASPQKTTTATAATGSSAAKVSSTSTTFATAAAKPATATKPATGAAAAPKPKPVSTAAASANKPASAATTSAQPGAQPSPPAVKKKPVPMDADNTSVIHGPFGWGD